MNTEEIKNLVYSYLDGNSDMKTEKKILEFILSGEKNKAQFSEWEKEWKTNRSTNADLSLLIDIENRISSKKKRIVAICSVAAVIAIVSFFTLRFLNMESAAPDEIRDNLTVVETGPCDRTKIALPDGSTVHLNSCSKLTYSGDFNRENRRIELSGEAFFDVNKNPSMPFVVDMGKEKIIVRGTKFNVSAYKKINTMSVALLEGKVEFSEGETTLTINSGEVVSFDKKSRNLTKHTDDVSQYSAWTNGRIEYQSVTLDVLLERLSCIYNLDIRYVPKKHTNKSFYISLSTQENIRDVLDAISVIIPIKWTKDKNIIIINEI